MKIGDWYYDDAGNYRQHTAESLAAKTDTSEGGSSNLRTPGCLLIGCGVVALVVFILIFSIWNYYQSYIHQVFPS